MKKSRTLEPGTITGYLEVAKRLHRNAAQSGSGESDIDVARYLISKKSTISDSTWRRYKAALMYDFAYRDSQDALAVLEPETQEGTVRASRNTSALKRKFMHEDEQALILVRFTELKDKGKNWGKELLSAFVTWRTLGCRPGETSSIVWYESATDAHKVHVTQQEYNGDFPMVRITNAKSTNGRSFGRYRYIDCSALPPQKRILVQISAAYFRKVVAPNGTQKTPESYYKAFIARWDAEVTRALADYEPENKKPYAGKITPYTCRHQLIADLKAAGYTKVEIAAIVGHGNDITAGRHYGKKKHGGGALGLVRANAIDAAKVRILTKDVATTPQPTGEM